MRRGDVHEGPLTGRLRVVIAKAGLDGHDRGAKVIARALRDAGMEVIYTGLHQTPEQIVAAAVQEDADVIGLSILSGAHVHICGRIAALLAAAGADDIPVVVGGIVPEHDVAILESAGVARVYPPGSVLGDIVDGIRASARRRVPVHVN